MAGRGKMSRWVTFLTGSIASMKWLSQPIVVIGPQVRS